MATLDLAYAAICMCVGDEDIFLDISFSFLLLYQNIHPPSKCTMRMLLDLNHSSHEIDLWTGRAGLTKNGAISDGRKRIKVSRQKGRPWADRTGRCKDCLPGWPVLNQSFPA